MSEETKGHIFEPFFTTKNIGEGTGLGLAAVYGTIKEHHGAVKVFSKPGFGTSFKLYLPLCVLPPGEVKIEDEVPRHYAGIGCILLADDEKIVRDSVSAMLQEIGYEVLLAEDGMEAIEIYKREHTRIDLVILDVVMPRLSGPDTFLALKNLNPDVRAIFSSGYTFENGARELLSSGAFGFIQKPFRKTDLYKVVQDSLPGQRQRQVTVAEVAGC